MEKDEFHNLFRAKLEALLFIYGDPLDIKKAAKILGVSVEEVASAAKYLRAALAESERGLTLVEHDGSLQLATKPEFGQLLQTVLKAELNEALSPASLETLSIITYAGPVSRAEIDYIRGVNSSFTVRALLLRGLITRETDPQRSNAYLYKPSIDLLRHIGVSRIEELPEFERFKVAAHSIKAASAPVAPTVESGTPDVVTSL